MKLAAIALAGFLLLAPDIGDRFLYYPAPYPVGDWSPEKRGLEVEDRRFASKDGTRLHAWWAPRANARATVLFLHGNGGNITNCAGHMQRLASRLDVQVLAVDYRGYGRSEGRPSEKGLYEDAEAAYDELTGPLGVKPEEVILYGHSLGTAVATELSLRRKCAGLVLEAPFTTILALVGRAIPVVDPAEIVSARYDTLSKAPRLGVPLLVIHGTRDRTIPIEMGRAVFDAAPEPKSFFTVDGAGHADCTVKGGDALYAKLAELLDQAAGKRPGAPPRERAEPALY